MMRLNCCISYTDEKKTTTLNNINGQTPLYWIITKMPELVCLDDFSPIKLI
jgi:hypothetical protein